MAKVALCMATSLRCFRGARFALFLVLFLGVEIFQFSSSASTNVSVPSDFTLKREELRNYMCGGCSNETTCSSLSFGCTFCQWLCRSSWGQQESTEQTVCQKVDSSTLCDEDQSVYCTYGDEAEVCNYDDSDESCMYRQTLSGYIYKYCVCDWDRERLSVFGRSCSDGESTTMKMLEPTTRMMTTEPTQTAEPLGTVNVAAIVLGSVLSVLLVAVALGLLFLFRTNKLKCGAGTSMTTADASIEMAQKDNERAGGKGSISSTNAYEDASTRDVTPDHAYKSLHLSQDKGSHYYSRIPDSSGTPGAHTAQQELTPSAPPTEGHGSDTEAQGGHEYFVLEREQSEQSKKENSNHEYFVLEKQDSSDEHDQGWQAEVEEDGDTLGKEVDSISRSHATQYEGYDRIKLSPQKNVTDNTYSHLNPNPEKEYDHLSRPGKT